MAAAMKSIVNEVRDITECSICTEMFCNPKMLPCFHTFCLKCIEQFCKDTEEGDTMPCPMCRKEFIVPSGGLSKLSGNFFMERLIAVQSASRMNEVMNCDVCLTGKQCKVEASFFCLECYENMCDSCSNNHKSMKMSMTHHLSTIGDPSAVEAIKKNIRRTFCDKHPTEEIKFFCRDCKIPFCATCFIARHNKHECCEIGEMVGEFKKVFKQHYNDVSELLASFEEQSDEVDEQFASFTKHIETTEKNILERSEAIKQMVDMHTQALIAELESHKTHFLRNIQNTKEELQRNMMMCKNFVSYCQKAIDEADAVESIRISDELKTRAEELEQGIDQNLNKLPKIQFHPSDLDVATNFHNIVGNIHVKHLLKRNLQGIAMSNNELFCISPASSVISVYNVEPFTFQRTISVEGMKRSFDIVAGDNVLYVSECVDELIHRIQLPEGTASNWTVDGRYSTLSISKIGNVIVASSNLACIREYTSDGTFVRDIAVNLFHLKHAIQLERDQFLICHTEKTHYRVCVIDNTGTVIDCYREYERSGKKRLNESLHLANCPNGSVLVADCNNNRIVQLSSSMEYINKFTGFKQPSRLLFNEEFQRLYVVESNDGSITIHDMSLGMPHRGKTPSPPEQSRTKRLRSPSRSSRADFQESSKMSRKSPRASRSRLNKAAENA